MVGNNDVNPELVGYLNPFDAGYSIIDRDDECWFPFRRDSDDFRS